jgi:predicted acylesterase/phospholipase RssA
MPLFGMSADVDNLMPSGNTKKLNPEKTSETEEESSYEGSSSSSDSKEWRKDLKHIARIFGVMAQKGELLENLENKCSTSILEAFKDGKWHQLDAARHYMPDLYKKYLLGQLFHSHSFVNFELNPPTGLVFKGGGYKGIGYAGVVRYLEKTDLLKRVERVAGSSAGAMTATFIALGVKSEDKLKELLLGTFKRCINCSDVGHSTGGLSTGKKVRSFFLKEINRLAEIKEERAVFTFGDLRDRIQSEKTLPLEERKWKHLHICINKIGAHPAIVCPNSEDGIWDDYLIADVLRASIALPIILSAHQLRKRKEDGTIIKVAGFYIDGGVASNLPTWAFDRRKYLENNSEPINLADVDNFAPNKRVLGFSFGEPERKIDRKRDGGDVLSVGLKTIGLIYSHESIVGKTEPINRRRIVHIENGKVGTLGFGLKNEDYDKYILSAYQDTEKFFKKQKEEAERLLAF